MTKSNTKHPEETIKSENSGRLKGKRPFHRLISLFRLQNYVSDCLMNFVHIDAPLAQIGYAVHFQHGNILNVEITAGNYDDGDGLMPRMLLELTDEVEPA